MPWPVDGYTPQSADWFLSIGTQSGSARMDIKLTTDGMTTAELDALNSKISEAVDLVVNYINVSLPGGAAGGQVSYQGTFPGESWPRLNFPPIPMSEEGD